MSLRPLLCAALLLAACTAPAPDAALRREDEAAQARQEAAEKPREERPGDPGPLDSVFAAAERETGGVLGVYAVHLTTGKRLRWRHRDRFPMASTYKLPIAVVALGRVGPGGWTLDQPVTLRPGDFRPSPSPVLDSLPPTGGTTTLRRLVESSLVYSDNTASDALLRMVGGPRAVTARVGISGMRVDRSEGQIHWDWNGVTQVPPESEWTLDTFRRLRGAVPQARRDSAHAAFYGDPRDTATPEGMVAVLKLVEEGRAMAPEMRDLLLRAMAASPTGPNRLRGMLPAGTVVQHKTGTIGQVVNDVGYVVMPDGGRVAIAVYVNRATAGTGAAERAIARVARAVYDHYLPRAGAQ